MMQTLLKNLFNSMNLLKTSLLVIADKIFQKPSVKGTLRYRKINFFTTSASYLILVFELRKIMYCIRVIKVGEH
jgi:hypothetical protein